MRIFTDGSSGETRQVPQHRCKSDASATTGARPALGRGHLRLDDRAGNLDL